MSASAPTPAARLRARRGGGARRSDLGRPATPDAQARPRSPNIVMVMTDDQTLESMSRETMPKTTKLIVRQGTDFEQAIATTPLCCPSRASLLTGQYAHNHGVLENDYGLLARRQLDPAGLAPGRGLPDDPRRQVDEPLQEDPRREHGRPRLGRVAHGARALLLLRLRPPDQRPREGLRRRARRLPDPGAERDRGRAGGGGGGRAKPFYLQLDHYAPHIAPGDKDRCDRPRCPTPRTTSASRTSRCPSRPTSTRRTSPTSRRSSSA